MSVSALRNNLSNLVNRPEISDADYDTFIKSGIHFISVSLRIKEMIEVDTATVTVNKVKLPAGWREIDYVRLTGGKPLAYRARHEFMGLGDRNSSNIGYYTLVGNAIIVGGPVDNVDGESVEVAYYASIPVPTDTVDTWIYDYNYPLLLSACASFAYAFTQEFERASMMTSTANGYIEALNSADRIARYSGTKLKAKHKGFG